MPPNISILGHKTTNLPKEPFLKETLPLLMIST